MKRALVITLDALTCIFAGGAFAFGLRGLTEELASPEAAFSAGGKALLALELLPAAFPILWWVRRMTTHPAVGIAYRAVVLLSRVVAALTFVAFLRMLPRIFFPAA